MCTFSEVETQYQTAKARLQAAQQEKLEAASDFLSARAALHQALETLWPPPCECGERLGYREAADEQRRTSASVKEAESRQALIALR